MQRVQRYRICDIAPYLGYQTAYLLLVLHWTETTGYTDTPRANVEVTIFHFGSLPTPRKLLITITIRFSHLSATNFSPSLSPLFCPNPKTFPFLLPRSLLDTAVTKATQEKRAVLEMFVQVQVNFVLKNFVGQIVAIYS